MLKVALTGGIATGKTHVLKRFAALGVPVIDADAIARDALARGTGAWKAVVEHFGQAVVTAEGEVDRKKLADVVFADPAARAALEAIVHPGVFDAVVRRLRELETESRHLLAIADIPLLYETGRASEFDRVIVVACAPAEQISRVMKRDGASETEARRRLAAQLPIDEKAMRADFVIRTDATIDNTDRQVDELYRRLVKDATTTGSLQK